MDSKDKSIITQASLEPSGSCFPDIQPLEYSLSVIHSGEQSFIDFKYKQNKKVFGFGSTASRISSQMWSQKQSEIVAYQPIFNPKQQDNLHFEKKIAPFGTSGDRFNQKKNYVPGPGKYELSHLKEIKKKSLANLFNHSIQKDNHSNQRENHSTNKQNQHSIGPGYYNDNREEIKLMKEDIRERMKQKIKAKKQKYQEMFKMHHAHTLKPSKQFLKKSITQELRKDTINLNSSVPKRIIQSEQKIDRYFLRQNTRKMFPQLHDFEANRFHDTFLRQGSAKTNFNSVFIDKKDKAYESYLPKFQDSPGPGHYINSKKTSLIKEQPSSIFKSTVERKLFQIKQEQKSEKRSIIWHKC